MIRELLLVCALAVVGSVLLARARIPMIAALLVTGCVAGPAGLAVLTDLHQISVFAEVGVIFLLFSIGLEFSIARIGRIARLVAVGGALQVGLTTLGTVAALTPFGVPLRAAIFLGFAVSLSSTAIVLRGLSERGETDAPHGRFIVGALIFQDLCVVPMMLLVPVLGGRGGASVLGDAAVALAKAAAVVTVTLLVARRVVPRLLDAVDRTRAREAFLLAVLVVCLGTAWLTALAGLSLALGAFLAGVVLADSEYAHRALGQVMPLRDVFTSLFFISLGMLFDVRVLRDAPAAVLGVAAAMLVGKTLAGAVACGAMRFPPAVAVAAGAGLAQFGEFGFVLLQAGRPLGLVTEAQSRVLLAAAVLTMLVTPLLLSAAPRLARSARRRLVALERLARAETLPPEDAAAPRHDHVVVVGYGVAGRTLARALRPDGVSSLVLELNAATVRAARAAGEPVYYGDIASEECFAHAGVARARALVLLINDADALSHAVEHARRAAPEMLVVARTPWAKDADALRALGATEVIAAEEAAGVAVRERLYARLGIG